MPEQGLNLKRNYEFIFFDVVGKSFDEEVRQEIILTSDLKTANKHTDALNIIFDYDYKSGVANSANFYVINPSQETIAMFSNQARRGFEFRAWYGESKSKKYIFKGLCFQSYTYRNGTDIVLHVTASDAFTNLQVQRYNKTFPSGTKYSDIIDYAISLYGNYYSVSGVENLEGFVSKNPYSTNNKSIKQVFEDVTQNCGLAFDFFGNEVAISKISFNDSLQVSTTDQFTLSYKTGLIGSPRQETIQSQLLQVNYFDKNKLTGNLPVVSASCLIVKPFRINDVILLECNKKELNAFYYILSVSYRGEYRGTEWAAHLRLNKVR